MLRGRETVTITRSTPSEGDDIYGNPLPNTVTKITVKGVLIAWGASTEKGSMYGWTENSAAVLYFPKNTQVRVNDKFTINGVDFITDGDTIIYVPQAGSPLQTRPMISIKAANS